MFAADLGVDLEVAVHEDAFEEEYVHETIHRVQYI
jgi:hypothetical protein